MEVIEEISYKSRDRAKEEDGIGNEAEELEEVRPYF
jgi:hypothetical protein